jgi:deoxyribonuclease V
MTVTAPWEALIPLYPWHIVDFMSELAGLLGQVPRGRVTSFKALAEALGDVRASKAVYRLLRDERPPGWHRVVRADGSIPFPEAVPYLREEGVGAFGDKVQKFQQLLFTDFQAGMPLKALRDEQRTLARSIVLEDSFGELTTVLGFDVSYQGQVAHAAAVVLDWDRLSVLEEVALRTRVSFPYISTYLAYREFEPIGVCYRRLRSQPSLLLVDGNGILHPASFGIACMVGVKLGKPTIGVAKSLLMGKVQTELAEAGQSSPVVHDSRVLGYAYKPTGGGKPIYVSPGHRVCPETALEIVRKLCRGRIPEPLRLADRAARQLKREATALSSTKGGRRA